MISFKIFFALSILVSLLLKQFELQQPSCQPWWSQAERIPQRRYSYSSKSDGGGRIHHPDKSNTVFATFSTPKAKKKRTQK
jgi:hypothetical protein